MRKTVKIRQEEEDMEKKNQGANDKDLEQR